MKIFDTIHDGYNIRSRFIHGQELDGNFDLNKIADLSKALDSILRRILLKVILEDSEIFVKYKTSERDGYLNSLVLGLPFDHEAIKIEIQKREKQKQELMEKERVRKEKTETQKLNMAAKNERKNKENHN